MMPRFGTLQEETRNVLLLCPNMHWGREGNLPQRKIVLILPPLKLMFFETTIGAIVILSRPNKGGGRGRGGVSYIQYAAHRLAQ